jgi:hypothetical protein
MGRERKEDLSSLFLMTELLGLRDRRSFLKMGGERGEGALYTGS